MYKFRMSGTVATVPYRSQQGRMLPGLYLYLYFGSYFDIIKTVKL